MQRRAASGVRTGRALWFLAAIVVAGTSAVSGASPEDDSRVQWLKEHAHPIRSLDLADDDFRDLHTLKERIGDCRVVGLGEQTHADGTCFAAKARLVRFLHQEMGFDVLVFESGLYDCHKAWLALQEEGDAARLAATGVFKVWSFSEQARPVFDYLQATTTGKRALWLAGFDCQMTGTASAEQLEGDLKAFFLTPRQLVDAKVLDACKPLLRALGDTSVRISAARRTSGMTALRRLIRVARTPEARKGRQGRLAGFWARVLEGYLALVPTRLRKLKRGKWADGNARDAQMARNVIWLAEKRFPGRKLILWAASSHLVRKPRYIDARSTGFSYRDARPMGTKLAAHFGKDYFTIALAGHEGSAGRPWDVKPRRVAPAPAGTLEALTIQAGFENAWFDLAPSRADGRWLTEPALARPMGTAVMEASWGRHFDVYLVLRTMTPSTGLANRPTPPLTAAGPSSKRPEVDEQDARVAGENRFVTLVRSMWRRIRQSRATGHAGWPKLSFVMSFYRWRKTLPYPSRDIRNAIEAVERWAEPKLRAEDFRWRYHELLGYLYAEVREHATALRHLDAALATMPDMPMVNQRAQSRFHHIAAKRAGVMVAQGRPEEASAFLVKTLVEDRRCRWIYVRDLGSYFGSSSWDLAAFKRFLDGLHGAFARRIERFPQRAEETVQARNYFKRHRPIAMKRFTAAKKR